MSSGNGEQQTANQTQSQTAAANVSEPGNDLGPNGQGNEAGGQNAKLAAWTQQLSKDYRENPELAQKLSAFEKLDDFAKSYFQLEGKSDIPGKDAKPEDVNAFWRRLGYPEKPEGYAVSKDQNAGTFISAAHTARLTDEQATAMWKSVSEYQARQFAAAQTAQAEELAATDAALKKEYGEKYDHALQMFNRGMGSSSELKALIGKSGLAGNPLIVKAFIALGEAQQESGSPRSDAQPGGAMKSIFEGGTFNYKT
jgi:hypothetical protein